MTSIKKSEKCAFWCLIPQKSISSRYTQAMELCFAPRGLRAWGNRSVEGFCEILICLWASSQYVWLDAQERSFPENPQHRNMLGILRQKTAFWCLILLWRGVWSSSGSEIPRDDLYQVTIAVFVLFTMWEMVITKEKVRFAIALKREDFKDVHRNATLKPHFRNDVFCLKNIANEW